MSFASSKACADAWPCAWSLSCASATARPFPGLHRADGALIATAGAESLALRAGVPVRGVDFRIVADFSIARGQRTSFVLTHLPSHERRPLPIDPGAAVAATQSAVRARQLRRALAGGGPAVPDHAQGAHLRSHGGDRRRCDHLAAGAYRRQAQLGLPLLLAARCHLRAVRAVADGLPRRSSSLAPVGRPLRGRSARRPAERVRARR